MLTLEVHGQYVTWPEQFALYMMRYYRNRGITFVVHRNCIHSGRDTTTERILSAEKMEQIGAFEFACGYR
ncbi:MAG TPA: hypothetical protein VF799_10420 [Geobacteraceae bacterium]